jgi:hypothetical protein
VNPRALGLAWVLVGALLVGGLLWELSAWRSLSSRASQASQERSRLTAEIRQKEDEIVKEMRTHAGLLQELQWNAAGTNPSVFLNRLADLAQGSRMRITAIGPLEKQSTGQFSKLWHTVQVTGPYREIRELAARVEGDKGVLEDMVIEARDPAQGPGVDDLSARFRMTSLELSAEGKKIVDRAVAAAGTGLSGRTPGLALPLPSGADGAVALRDPFVFGPGVALPRPPADPPPSAAQLPTVAALAAESAAPPPAAPRADSASDRVEIPMELRGIVGFPGGHLAILNNQIVKVGDSVAGHRVERITERDVLLKSPDGGTRTVPLPAMGVTTGPDAPGSPPGGPAPPANGLPALPRR